MFETTNQIWWFPEVGVPQIISTKSWMTILVRICYDWKPWFWGTSILGNLHITSLGLKKTTMHIALAIFFVAQRHPLSHLALSYPHCYQSQEIATQHDDFCWSLALWDAAFRYKMVEGDSWHLTRQWMSIWNITGLDMGHKRKRTDEEISRH